MYGIARKTVDTAGGAQLAGGQGFVFVEGHLVVLDGDPVEPHGDAIHGAPVMTVTTGGFFRCGDGHCGATRLGEIIPSAPFVFINGIAVCREDHLATCGHPTTGSSLVRLSG